MAVRTPRDEREFGTRLPVEKRMNRPEIVRDEHGIAFGGVRLPQAGGRSVSRSRDRRLKQADANARLSRRGMKADRDTGMSLIRIEGLSW
jgi:hypothetical protein